MSDYAEKFLPNISSVGRTLAKLSDLRKMYGKLEIVEGTEEMPLRIVRRAMGDCQSWKRYGPATGQNATFSLEREG